MNLTAQTDGGSRGNPGPAASAAIIRHGDLVIASLGKYLGETTNNVAEYEALIMALEYAVEQRADSLTVYSDSQLVVKQMRSEYGTNDLMMPFKAKALVLAGELKEFHIFHIRREYNSMADKRANDVLDRTLGVKNEIMAGIFG